MSRSTTSWRKAAEHTMHGRLISPGRKPTSRAAEEEEQIGYGGRAGGRGSNGLL